MNENFIEKLTETANSLGVGDRVFFHSGTAAAAVAALAPFGKAAVVYSKPSFLRSGKSLTASLKKAGVKPLNFIIPEDAPLNFNNVFDVIGIPEDMRAIVCADYEVKDVCFYVATLFSIPVLFILNSVITRGVLASETVFRNFGVSDFPPVNCVRHFVFDDNAVSADGLSEQYAFIMSQITALTDYRVRITLSGEKANKAAYDAMKNAVINSFRASDITTENLLLNGFIVEIADFAAGGKIIGNSAAGGFLKLTGFARESGLTFSVLNKLLLFYALCAEQKEDAFNLPDYNARAAEMAELTGSDCGVFVRGFLKQLKYLKDGEKIKKLKSGLKEELKSQSEALRTIKENYIKAGGALLSDFSPYVKAFKHCGDMPETLNFMSLIRESGLAEYI